MLFFIKVLTGHTISIEVELSDTIGFLKSKIEKKENIAKDNQNIIFSGRSLDDNNTLEYYNVHREGPLFLRIISSENKASSV
tara:strand:- start:1119 stop:1364 length:246 start_codon:yes stop_codon:yes gene_type:complete